MNKKIYYYELCFYHAEDDDLATEDACSYCIKTEIYDINEELALNILFYNNSTLNEQELRKNLTGLIRISEDEAIRFFDVDDLTYRIEDGDNVYYVRTDSFKYEFQRKMFDINFEYNFKFLTFYGKNKDNYFSVKLSLKNEDFVVYNFYNFERLLDWIVSNYGNEFLFNLLSEFENNLHNSYIVSWSVSCYICKYQYLIVADTLDEAKELWKNFVPTTEDNYSWGKAVIAERNGYGGYIKWTEEYPSNKEIGCYGLEKEYMYSGSDHLND